jgi:hypothetical protein
MKLNLFCIFSYLNAFKYLFNYFLMHFLAVVCIRDKGRNTHFSLIIKINHPERGPFSREKFNFFLRVVSANVGSASVGSAKVGSANVVSANVVRICPVRKCRVRKCPVRKCRVAHQMPIRKNIYFKLKYTITF